MNGLQPRQKLAFLLEKKVPTKLVVHYAVGGRFVVVLPGDLGRLFQLVTGDREIAKIEVEDNTIRQVPGSFAHGADRLSRVVFARKGEVRIDLPDGGSFALLQYGRQRTRDFRLLNDMRALQLTSCDHATANCQLLYDPLEREKILKSSHCGRAKCCATIDAQMAAQSVIVVHLYFDEAWPDIREAIYAAGLDCDILISIPEGAPAMHLAPEISKEFKRARIKVVENRGRDVWPFLEFLNAGELDQYNYICKLHSKSSSGYGNDNRLGQHWRRRFLLDLLGGPSQVREVFNLFLEGERVGMVGPKSLRLPNRLHRDLSGLASTGRREELCRRTFGDVTCPTPDFFAGTMFWAYRPALDALKGAGLRAEEFIEENGVREERLENAIERFFGDCVRLSGWNLSTVTPFRTSEFEIACESCGRA